MVKTVIWGLAFMTLLSQLFLLKIAVFYVLERLKVMRIFTIYKKYLTPYALYLAFTVTVTATLGSLFFSEVAKFQPCVLCWYQRILTYPQPILLLVAFIRRETIIKPYLTTLSIVGACFSAYHYALQIWPKNLLAPCSDETVSCIKATFYFGYISIPMMALTAFILSIVLLTFVPKQNPSHNKSAKRIVN